MREVRWYAIGPAVLAEVEAPTQSAALAKARARLGKRVIRVQSVASARVSEIELAGPILRGLYGRELAPGYALVVRVPSPGGKADRDL